MTRDPRPALVFGGTFDPPHRVHLAIARQAADALDARVIFVIPAAINPQRAAAPPASSDDRLAMTQLAFRDEPRAQVLDIEIRRGGPSYTIDTLKEFVARGETSLRLLVGSDQALNLPTWKSWHDVVEIAPPAIVLRPPHDTAAFAQLAIDRFGADAETWLARVLPVAPVDMRSTDIREALAHGENRAMNDLDPEVERYIRARLLYGIA